jgi:serine protease SohB
MEYLAEYGLFLAKAITIVVATLAVVGGIVGIALRQRRPSKEKLVVEHLNKRYEDMARRLSSALATDADLRYLDKAERKKHKEESKSAKKKAKRAAKSPDGDGEGDKKRVFVLDFEGDVQASAVKAMREEISAVLTVATPRDEVMLRLESAGGLVYSYGLAASQLQRIRDAQIPLTISVDKVAASGGYMMACVGDKVIAAPFALLGSIGVIAQLPNLHRLLKKHNVDFEQLYAGEYKRTLSLFGENTDKGRAKMREELEDTHQLFKDFIEGQRPKLDVDRVATGETWLGTRALELGLVDELRTSDDYLMAASKEAALIHLSLQERKKVMGTLAKLFKAGPALDLPRDATPQIYL